jgi:iron complex transport system substrate-binding protein
LRRARRRPGIVVALVAAASLALAACVPSAPSTASRLEPVASTPPRRIVSINPCIDAILWQVAEPRRIAGISHYSHDSRATSVPLDWARRFRAVGESAEDVLAAEPDLVLAGPHVARQTIAALQRLRIPLLQLPVATRIAEEQAQIATVAARVGAVQRGRELNARIDSVLKISAWRGERVLAIIWQGNGLVPGADTLADALLEHTGFRNASALMGLRQWDLLPLEDLLANPPKVLFAGAADMSSGAADSNRMLAPPALRAARAHIRVEDFPSRLLHCGGPTLIATLTRLSEARRGFSETP